MREEHKLNKAIKQDGVDTQSEILDELKRRYPQYVEQSDKKRVDVRKRKRAFIFAFAAVVACTAIVVPCSVLLPDRNNGGNGGGNGNIRYCTQRDYSKADVEYTIGEYRENNNLNFLYFDWYELCEERRTFCYTSNSDNEVLCLAENVYLPESDEFVQLSITKENVYLSEFDQFIDRCKNERSFYSHVVKWVVNEDDAISIFEHGGYRYFIRVLVGQDENRLFEFVAELLGKN